MFKPVDTEQLDAVFAHFRKFADTLERLIPTKCAVAPERLMDIAETLADAKRQLSELAGIADIAHLDAERMTMCLNLRNRYELLEGTFKELRNDTASKYARSARGAKRLHPLPSDDDR